MKQGAAKQMTQEKVAREFKYLSMFFECAAAFGRWMAYGSKLRADGQVNFRAVALKDEEYDRLITEMQSRFAAFKQEFPDQYDRAYTVIGELVLLPQCFSRDAFIASLPS